MPEVKEQAEKALRRYGNVHRCGQPLTDIPVIPVTDLRLLEIQQWINFGFGEGPRPGGRAAHHLFLFPALIKMILQLHTPEMFRDSDPVVRAAHARSAAELPFDGPLADDASRPLLMAGALHLADQLISGKRRRAKAVEFADLARAELDRQRDRWPVPITAPSR
ncbi:hypothetical protein [Streptomyces hesseae]|uniref:Uncharacterized protein n=1 Tax=Streptomyces hesseae TaxID=3075519 RepID=A0ABU2SFM1_9ACTN|nr:hypothetical protein [Streptomyces sp. DSM 40473]MDT0447782.1 hypothetical protein [Streptomyces sp. DSM 40473]